MKPFQVGLTLLFAACSGRCLVQAQEIAPLGRFAVGLRLEVLRDPSGSPISSEEGASSKKVWIWYPAQGSDQSLLSYVQIIELAGSAGWEGWFYEEPLKFGVERPALDTILDIRTNSVLNAEPADSQGPLVIYLPGSGHPGFIHIGMSELLLSHGYVVCSTDWGWGQNKGNFLENQLQDALSLTAMKKKDPQFDGQNIAVTGHRAGGLAAAAETLRSDHYDAMVSIDGGGITVQGMQALREHPEMPEAKLNIPTLHLLSRWWRTRGELHHNYDGSLLEATRREAYVFDFKHMEHSDFVTLNHLRSRYIDYAKFGVEYSAEKANRGYRIGLRYVLEFLNLVLRRESSSQQFLTAPPIDHGFKGDIELELINIH